jgi:hypothetical protein
MHSNICIQIVTIELSVCSLDCDLRIATKWLVFQWRQNLNYSTIVCERKLETCKIPVFIKYFNCETSMLLCCYT